MSKSETNGQHLDGPASLLFDSIGWRCASVSQTADSPPSIHPDPSPSFLILFIGQQQQQQQLLEYIKILLL